MSDPLYGERPVDEPTADPAEADGAPHGGSGLVAERARRQGLVDEMRRAGREPYPYRFDRTHTAGRGARRMARPRSPAPRPTAEVAVAGRVVLKRDAGKLVFATIAERGRSCSCSSPRPRSATRPSPTSRPSTAVTGSAPTVRVMTTRAGELSVKVDRLELLAKSIRPLPDKWHGLHDPDTRFRQRYVDLVVNADARRAFDVRHEVLASFRRTLRGRGYIEVETPILHVEAGGAHARPFVTHHHTLDMEMYLRVATELHLKRLIVGGMDRVFEIGRTFRNEGLSPRHNPEFTMMESYEAYADWTDVVALTEDLIRTAARDALGTTVVTIRGETVDLADEWPRRRMIDLVSEAIGEEVHPSQPVERLRARADSLGVRWEESWGSGKLIEELFGATVEPGIVAPVFVTGHPVEISPLARVDRDDPYLTERFELFADSVELANGYSELNDPVEQRLRFEEEQRAKEAGDAERGSIDEDYLRALEYGMPPTGGLGVGIDRLVMMLVGRDHDPRRDPVPDAAPRGFDMTRTAWGAGFTTEAADGTTLDAWYRWLGWGEYGVDVAGGGRHRAGGWRPRRCRPPRHRAADPHHDRRRRRADVGRRRVPAPASALPPPRPAPLGQPRRRVRVARHGGVDRPRPGARHRPRRRPPGACAAKVGRSSCAASTSSRR